MWKFGLTLGAIVLGLATPCAAAVTAPCEEVTITFSETEIACAGLFSGNVRNNSPTARAIRDDVAEQFNLLPLGMNSTSSLVVTENGGSSTISFGQTMSGHTLIAIEFALIDGLRNQTAFYLFDFSAGVNELTLSHAQVSATLYRTQLAVPEPGTWAMTLVGFLVAGSAVRRTRPQSNLTQIA